MKLAYGKFSPDLNPPPFSEWSTSLTAVEVDLFEYFSWKSKVVDYFYAWIDRKELSVIVRVGVRTQRSADEYREAFALWMERFKDRTIYFAVHSGRKEWDLSLAMNELRKLPIEWKYFFEWGKDDSIRGTEVIKSLGSFGGWIVDPDWHSKSIPLLKDTLVHFKLHGWSDERWVRRYGVSQASRINRIVRSRDDAALTLSYSGKVPEAFLFAVSS